MSHYTVFGGTGYVGRHLVAWLEARGHEVFIPHRQEFDPRAAQPLGHVIYAIGMTADFRGKPLETVRAHVTVLEEILRHCNFESFLYLSSTRIYGVCEETREDAPLTVSSANPSHLYNLSKLMGESLVLQSGNPGMRVARLSNIVGGPDPSPSFIASLIHDARLGAVRLRTAPDSSKDYLHISDAVRMLADVAERGRHQVYNVASGKNLRHREWAEWLEHHYGCRVEFDQDAPLQKIFPISIDRYLNEFGHSPQCVFKLMGQMS